MCLITAYILHYIPSCHLLVFFPKYPKISENYVNYLMKCTRFDFIAVPCSMLINLAIVMDSYLNQNRGNNDVSLKLLFFDGEEAFLNWSPKDSIYGARHLADKWEKEGFLPQIVGL